MFTCCKIDDKKSSKNEKNDDFSGSNLQHVTHFSHKKNNILKKFLHMFDLEKNDKIFTKKSRHVFCEQIYQIHHCKYEIITNFHQFYQ